MINRARDMLPEVESDYAGPKMETVKDSKGRSRGKITKEYVDGMRAWFKDGKVRQQAYFRQLVAHTDISSFGSDRQYTVGTLGRSC
jgi:hypothetical protein